ncbi:MAG: PEP-CTERM sorting domain-containing protein [Acidiferrobacteraceae bacterium]
MKINLKKLLYGGCVGLLLSSSAHAASVSYFLNENNSPGGALPPNNYGVVTLSDRTSGGVRFTVTPENLTPGTNFGIDEFGFNSNSNIHLTSLNYFLPSGWSLVTRGSNTMDGYGSFNDITSGTGSTLQNPLTFYVNVGTIADYQVTNSKGNYFAAHIMGFNNNGVTSAYFASDITPVPEPATAWLLGPGLMVLGAVVRKRKPS